jgi:hypothetical protein
VWTSSSKVEPLRGGMGIETDDETLAGVGGERRVRS